MNIHFNQNNKIPEIEAEIDASDIQEFTEGRYISQIFYIGGVKHILTVRNA